MHEQEKKDLPDLGSEPADDFDPFASDDDLGEENNGAKKPRQEAEPSKKNAAAKSNPLESAIVAAQDKDAEKARQGLIEKPPVFEHGGATEEIEDLSQTFDELRIAKAVDFAELEDGKRVSWSVEYGKLSKAVADPKGMSIGKMKSDIEASKEFFDSLKKSKDKNPTCKIKPRVTAQSKGESVKGTSYKGVYMNEDEAIASGKLITLFPGKDGTVYEMRNNVMGRFITPAANNDILKEVKAGFIPALPPVPLKQLGDILGFFRLMAKNGENEALANVYWDTQDGIFLTDIPKQVVSPYSVKGVISPVYDSDRYVHYMDIHSHGTMRAFFSATDDADEKATRVYAVAGKVHGYFPEIKVRISNGGKFLEIDPGTVFEDFNKATKHAVIWFNQFQNDMRLFSDVLSSVFGRYRHRRGSEPE